MCSVSANVAITCLNTIVQVILPHIHFTESELQALQDPDTVHEATAMRDAHQACFEVVILQPSLAPWLCLMT